MKEEGGVRLIHEGSDVPDVNCLLDVYELVLRAQSVQEFAEVLVFRI